MPGSSVMMPDGASEAVQAEAQRQVLAAQASLLGGLLEDLVHLVHAHRLGEVVVGARASWPRWRCETSA